MAEHTPPRALVRQSQHFAHLDRRHPRCAVGTFASEIGISNRLVEDREAVAHRTFRRRSHQGERFGFGLDGFIDADFGEMRR